MDIIRGIAIIFMTVYHQGLVYSLDGRANHVSYFLGYLAAPFFLAVSGGALWYHERHYRWPIKMIVHGITLFLFAWMVDVIAHQRFNIDWDIFQLIGIGYAIIGAFNILGNNTRKYFALAILIGLWAVFPNLRPDKGVFAIWPYGMFFLAGYFFTIYAKSRLNSAYLTTLLVFCMILYVSYWIYVGLLPHIIALEGIFFAICLCLLLWSLGFVLEYKKALNRSFFSLLLRYGTYPLTLYYCQQTIALFCIKYQIHLNLFPLKTINWICQASLLLIVMLFITYILDHYKFFSIEWWLRKMENTVLNRLPNREPSSILVKSGTNHS
ncbi:MAG: hypothetical protein SWH54_18880 [Thermodesulfobacteriota bacterium]|nr:hypothetical protein [Thermodesulfobacteriota bacterium]